LIPPRDGPLEDIATPVGRQIDLRVRLGLARPVIREGKLTDARMPPMLDARWNQ
jgi:hypothetical protein